MNAFRALPYPHGNHLVVGMLVLVLLHSGSVQSGEIPGYEDRQIEGWTVQISKELLRDQPEATNVALDLLQKQLRTVVDVLPEKATQHVREVPIWLSPPYEGYGQKAEYHPDADWLEKEGRHPKLAQSVELTNIAIFEKEIKRMPMLMLHELAHAYHHRVLGFEQKEILTAYQQAVENNSYERVERGNGRIERAYAITNHKEYFAETSECYFGVNDFYPFDKNQLRRHDETMFHLLSKLWGVSPNKDSDSSTPTE